jgi:hypothetical protein
VVLLSSIQYPGHIVGIRDATGSPYLPNQPIVISTTAGVKFYDGTSSLTIKDSSISVVVSSKDSNTWQLLNNVGFFTSLSNAYLSSLTSQFAYINTMSSIKEVVSTSVIGNIDITNTILLGGNTEIIGDITVNGPVNFLSAMTVQKNLSLSSILSVGSNFVTTSSFVIRGDVIIGGAMSTLNNLQVSDLVVDQNISAYALLLPYNLSVQTLRVGTLNTADGIQIAQNLSTSSNLFLGEDLLVQGSSLIQSSIVVYGSTAIGANLYGGSNFTTRFFSLEGSATIEKEGSVEQNLIVQGEVIANAELRVTNRTDSLQTTLIQDGVLVTGDTEFRDLYMVGNVNISTFKIYSSVTILNDALSYGSLYTVTSDFNVQGEVGVGEDVNGRFASASLSTGVSTVANLGVGSNLFVGGLLSVGCNLNVGLTRQGISTFSVQGTLSTGNLHVFEDLNVLSNLYVKKVLGASTLGAPIDLTISTLTLSNIFFAKERGTVPLLDANGYPDKILVGPVEATNYDVAVEGVLQNLSTLDQTTWPEFSKLWYANEVRTSTIIADMLVSSLLVGSAGAPNPFQTFYGAILTGDFNSSENLYYSSNLTSNYATTANMFAGPNGGSKVVWNGSNQWVAVGDGTGAGTTFSILTSRNGYNWTNATTGGFTQGGRSVAYGNGTWVAVGYTPGIGSNIQYSTDGLNWSNATNSFNPMGSGEDVAYNGSNRWVAVGDNFILGSQGIKYSGNGILWSNATLMPPVPFVGKGVGYGNGKWVASDGSNRIFTSTDGNMWSLIGQPLGKTSFAYNGTYWVAGGPATSNNPTLSIHLSPDGTIWFPIQSGGFTNECADVIWDSVNSIWLATGSTSPPTQVVVQYSSDGMNWLTASTFPDIGQGKGIGVGTISAPDNRSYFTVNTTTIIHPSISSSVLYTSSINTSSLLGQSYTGDGAQLSNVVNFRANIYTSSLFLSNAYTIDVSAQRLQTEFAALKDSLTVLRNPFLSSIDQWVAAGYDSQSNGNIQTSFSGTSWNRGIGPSFNYFAKSITGNGNISSPIYVATGADSRTNYTIQWSQNARIWNPVDQGGFDIAVDGVKTGNSVTYNSNLDVWVAGGFNPGTTSTLFYSTDARNWFCASNAFNDTTNFVTTSPSGFIALGQGIKYSFNGSNWFDSATSITLDTLAYGLVSTQTFLGNAILGFSNLNIYFSVDGGINWQLFPSFTTLFPVDSVVYGGSNWVAVGSNKVQYSPSGVSWSNVTTEFANDVLFNAVAYNSNQSRWVAGAVSTTADKSLWTTTNILNWSSAQSGGFSTTILESGVGYGIFTSSTYTFAVGQGSFTGVNETKPNILSVEYNNINNYTTENVLTQANASNVFGNNVRAIYGSADETYKYVAVGDGETPQKTIARSLTGEINTWIPAITGGFSTTGYGVTHYNDIWIAVGDAQASSNTIQYSPDGANWFGTNTANAIRIGGRGVAQGVGTLSSRIVATGRDTARSTFAYSSDGYTWSGGVGSFFLTQGNAVAGGSNGSGPNFIAVGQDTRGFRSTILQSQDGITWSNTTTGGFSGGGFGVAYGLTNTYVAVGMDTNSNRTIQYSTDGGENFSPVNSGAFTRAGYAVGYNTLSNVFFAVGEDAAARRNATIKFSANGSDWQNISTGSGFLSQTTLGAAYSLYTQQILNAQISPYMEFSNLFVYEGEEPLLYPYPTVRLQSSFMVFNEAMTMNLSSQMMINTYRPYSASTVLTVNGNIYASSLIYTGEYITTDTLIVSSLVVSTLSTVYDLNSIYLTTPSLQINTEENKANFLSSSQDLFFNYDYNGAWITNVANVNQTLFATANMPIKQKTGIKTQTPLYDLDVSGSLGTSSFSTSFVFAPGFVQTLSETGVSLRDPYFSIVNGSEGTVVSASNSILATPSSLLLNGVLNLNLSSQKVGVFTTNPRFTLDVQAQAYIQTLSTPVLNTSLLFLTLQSA